MKKILLTLGSIATVAASVTTIISCGFSDSDNVDNKDRKKPKIQGGLSSKQDSTNIAAHEKELAATSHNGTKANNVEGEDLRRPFVDIADTQDENTIYQSSGVITKTFAGSMPLTSTNMSLKDFNADTADFDFNDFTSISIHIVNKSGIYILTLVNRIYL